MKRLLLAAFAAVLVVGHVHGAFAQTVPGAFLLYPNYRGLIFSDRPEIVVDAPSGAAVTVRDKVNGSTVATATSNGSAVKIAATSLTNNHPYTVTVVQGGTTVGTWDVKPVPATDRASMNISTDKDGRFLMHGEPRFGLGVYDSGLPYHTNAAAYESMIFAPGGNRQLGGINLNMYLNYHYGEASLSAMNALMDALQNHGMMYLQTANCFAAGSYTRIPFAADQGTYATEFARHKGAAGFYIMDECEETLIAETKQHHAALSAKAPGTMNLAVMLGGPKMDTRKFAETGDVIGNDPYPLYGAEPSYGYSHFQVADYIAYTKSAVKDSRPVFSVLQFFKFTSDSRWPTAAEQRAHAIMSIVEGADGIFWWEIGQNGLQKDPAQFATQMPILKANVNELAALEKVLVAPDAPTALVGNSTKYADEKAGRIAQLGLSKTNSWLYHAKNMYQAEIDRINAGDLSHSPMLKDAADIRTKVKVVDGKGYVFAYNYTNKTLPVTFTWNTAPGAITENKSGKTYAAAGNAWSDSFGPYESRIYVIANGGSGGSPTPTPTPTPPPPTAGDPTVAFTNPANGATVSGTTTVTVAGSGGSGTGYTYKVTAGTTQIYAGTNPSFSWNTTTVANGAATLTATVTDSNGKTGTATRSVTVSNTTTTPPAGSPTAAFTSPAAGAIVKGTVTIGMASTGGATGARTFKLERVVGTTATVLSTQTVTGTSASFAWNTATSANGSVSLRLTVRDAAGKVATTTRSVTVSNLTTAPAPFTATFNNPAANATLRGNVSIGVSTTAPWGKSKTVSIAVDGKTLTTRTITGTTLWYTFNTTTVANGTRTLKVSVTYNGATATATRTVTVSN